MVDSCDHLILLALASPFPDSFIQTAAVLLFANKSMYKQYTDFSYQHHTIIKGHVTSGGLETGSEDVEWKSHMREYLRRYIYRSDLTRDAGVYRCVKTGTYQFRRSKRTPRCGGDYGLVEPQEERDTFGQFGVRMDFKDKIAKAAV